MSDILGFEPKELNTTLKNMRNIICALPPGEARNDLQRRFDLVVSRIAAIEHRVMVQLDAGTIKSDAEFGDVYATEMLWALDGFDEGAR